VADAGVLLSKVNSIKNSGKTWLGIDAGMQTLIRPALYKSYHHIVAAKEVITRDAVFYNIVGPICENTDIFATNYQLPEMFKNDVIAIMCTGAYGYGMSSQYNTQCRPAEIMIKNGEARLIRRADDFVDLYSNVI
jgi:diaminopimelate decarboxylase